MPQASRRKTTLLESRSKGLDRTRDNEPHGHSLVIVEGPNRGHRIVLAEGATILGREPGPSVVEFEDLRLSRRHCEIDIKDGQAHIKDLASTNGTFVEGERLRARIRLFQGCFIEVGNTKLCYQRHIANASEPPLVDLSELSAATKYLDSLLPDPVRSGPVQADWLRQRSATSDQSAFGFYAIDNKTFVCFSVEVRGDGVAPIVHCASLLNLLNTRALPGVDLAQPAEVLSALNQRFQMDFHQGLSFAMWYGVYHDDARELRYSSGGHHPALWFAAASDSVHTLRTSGLIMGAIDDARYETHQVTPARGDRLYLLNSQLYEASQTQCKHPEHASLAETFGRHCEQPQALLDALAGPAKKSQVPIRNLMSIAFV